MWNFKSFSVFFLSSFSLVPLMWRDWRWNTLYWKEVCPRPRKSLVWRPVCALLNLFFPRKITSWGLIDDGCLSSYQGRLLSASSFFFTPLPGDWWCNVLGFVPADSISNSSTLPISDDASHLRQLLSWPVCLPSLLPSIHHVQGSTTTGVFKGRCWTLPYANLGFPLQVSFFSHAIPPIKISLGQLTQNVKGTSRTVTKVEKYRKVNYTIKEKYRKDNCNVTEKYRKVHDIIKENNNNKRKKHRKVSYTIKVQESTPYYKL